MSEPTIAEVNMSTGPEKPPNEPETPLNEPAEVPGQREAYANAAAKLADQGESTAYQGLFYAYLRRVSALLFL